MTSTALACDNVSNNVSNNVSDNTGDHTHENPAETLGCHIVDLCTQINMATYQLLVLIAEFERHQYGERQGFLSTANWLNYQCGIGLVAAREKVRVALALDGLPSVAAAFRDGLLSYSKVRAITRVATEDNEAALLDIARHATASQAERIFRQYRQTLDSAESSGVAEAKNAFNWHWDEAGNLVFRGVLSAEQGALVLAAVQQAVDTGADLTDALAVVAQSALCSDVATSVTGATSATSEAGKKSSSSAERYQIHIELDANTQNLRSGPGITDRIIERLSCDASIITHGCDERGEPLSVGRKTRIVPPAIRRALEKRDQGCRFPGCTHRRFVDAHHVQHWAYGGETKLSNLILLCTAHHKCMHEAGFRIEVDPNLKGPLQPRFIDPRGQEIRPIVRPLIPGQVIALFANASAEFADASNGESNDKSNDKSFQAQTNTSPLAPSKATSSPDYQHINWVLTNFNPPERN